MAVTLNHTTNGGQLATSGTSISWTHDCTGDNYLLVHVSCRANASSMTGTFNGTSMTLLAGPTTCTAGQYAQQWVFGLASPSSGSYTVSLSWSGSVGASGCSASYSGVDSINTPTQQAGNTTYTQTIGANDMVVGLMALADQPTSGGATWTPAYDVASTYNGAQSATAGGINHNTGSGSVSVTLNYNTGTENVTCGLVFTGSATSAIKTVGGLAKASVKTVGGLAIASVKDLAGLA